MAGDGRPIRKLTSREYFWEALLSLLETRPAGKVSVSELCRQAGLSRPTFYAHWETLDDFLSQAQERVATGFIASTGLRACPDKILHRQSAREAYAAWFDYINRERRVLSLFLGEHGFPGFRHALIAQGIDTYRTVLDKAERRFCGKVTAQALATYVVSAHMGLMDLYLAEGDRYTAEQMADQLVALTFDGFFSTLGILVD